MLCFLFDQLNKRTANRLRYALSPGVFRHRKVIRLKEIIAWDCVGALRCITTIWHQIPQLHSFLYLLSIKVYICFSSYCIRADQDQRGFCRRVGAQVQRRAASMAFVEEALSWEGGIAAYELECMRGIHPNRTCLKNNLGACFTNAC